MNKQVKNLQEKIKKSMVGLLFLFAGIQIAIVNTYATSGNANVDAVTKPINMLNMMLEAIVSAAGVFIIIWNIGKLGQALPAHDNSAINMAVLGIIGGAIMTLSGSVLMIMGLK